MLIQNKDKKFSDNGPTCKFWEYNANNKNISIGFSIINGRYPQSGWCVNEQCAEAYCVVGGSGKITTEQGTYLLKKNDVFIFNAGEKFFCEGKNLKFWCACGPAWFASQHKYIE